jgi:hypothetical protein
MFRSINNIFVTNIKDHIELEYVSPVQNKREFNDDVEVDIGS